MNDAYLTKPFWMHVKTGNLYYVTGFSTREKDQMTLVNYRRCGPDEYPTWTRPAYEFFDGRFVRNHPDLKWDEVPK